MITVITQLNGFSFHERAPIAAEKFVGFDGVAAYTASLFGDESLGRSMAMSVIRDAQEKPWQEIGNDLMLNWQFSQAEVDRLHDLLFKGRAA